MANFPRSGKYKSCLAMKHLSGEMVVMVALFTGLIYSVLGSDKACSHPWTIVSEDNGTTKCECGDTMYGVVRCDPNTFQLKVLQSYCMTHSDVQGTTVDHCILTFLAYNFVHCQ